jgi:hypothetical protein
MGLEGVQALYFDCLITNAVDFAQVYGQKGFKNISLEQPYQHSHKYVIHPSLKEMGTANFTFITIMVQRPADLTNVYDDFPQSL